MRGSRSSLEFFGWDEWDPDEPPKAAKDSAAKDSGVRTYFRHKVVKSKLCPFLCSAPHIAHATVIELIDLNHG